MELVIENSLRCSMNYEEYRVLVKQLVASSSTTGIEKSVLHIAQTKLNCSRLTHWDETIKLSKSFQKIIGELNHSITFLVISESWCNDSAHILPVLNKIAEYSDKIDLRIVLRDENLELMNNYLTLEKQAIPKVIMIDNESGDVFGTYGPRPSIATTYVNRFMAMHGALTLSFKEDLQHWYHEDKGKNIITDLTKILSEFEPNVCQ